MPRSEQYRYRDYEITATHNPPFWNVGIHPRLSRLPKPGPMVVDHDKDRAIAEARRRIDVLLSGARDGG
jgi:hypothetical protein